LLFVYAQSYTSEISGGDADFALIILVVDLTFICRIIRTFPIHLASLPGVRKAQDGLRIIMTLNARHKGAKYYYKKFVLSIRRIIYLLRREYQPYKVL